MELVLRRNQAREANVPKRSQDSYQTIHLPSTMKPSVSRETRSKFIHNRGWNGGMANISVPERRISTGRHEGVGNRGVEVASSFQNMRFPAVPGEGVVVGKRSRVEEGPRVNSREKLEREADIVGTQATEGHKPANLATRTRRKARTRTSRVDRGTLLDSEHSPSY